MGAIDGVDQDLSEKVLSPPITPDENSRDVMLDTERATEVLAYLEKYEYATIDHVAIALMWHTMMRVGGIHALDVEDYDPEEQYLEVRHRAEKETPIKNKGDGERLVALSDQLCTLIDDWLDNQRPDVTDDFGRRPLLSSNRGRAGKTTLRCYVYRRGRPSASGLDPEAVHSLGISGQEKKYFQAYIEVCSRSSFRDCRVPERPQRKSTWLLVVTKPYPSGR